MVSHDDRMQQGRGHRKAPELARNITRYVMSTLQQMLARSVSNRLGCRLLGIVRHLRKRRSLFTEWFNTRWKVRQLKSCVFAHSQSMPRCVVAILSSNMEASLFVAAKNHLKGEWVHVSTVQHDGGGMTEQSIDSEYHGFLDQPLSG